MFRLDINGQTHEVGDDVDPKTPLLWVLRDTLGLVGTKYGCGVGQCSACTVQLNGFADPILPAAARQRRGPEDHDDRGHREGRQAHRRAASLDRGRRSRSAATAKRVKSCARRRCSRALPKPTDDEIDTDMAANICRCGTYTRIRKAIHNAADKIAKTGGAS